MNTKPNTSTSRELDVFWKRVRILGKKERSGAIPPETAVAKLRGLLEGLSDVKHAKSAASKKQDSSILTLSVQTGEPLDLTGLHPGSYDKMLCGLHLVSIEPPVTSPQDNYGYIKTPPGGASAEEITAIARSRGERIATAQELISWSKRHSPRFMYMAALGSWCVINNIRSYLCLKTRLYREPELSLHHSSHFSEYFGHLTVKPH